MDQTEARRPVYSAEKVPVIDFAPLAKGEPGALERLAREAHEASTSLGFFFIANHGVAQPLIDRMFEETARFHGLPLERKLEVKVYPDLNVGYLPLGGQTQLSYSSLYGPSKHPDASISYFCRREWQADHPDKLANKPWTRDNQWPRDLPGFRETALEYFGEMTRVAREVLRLHAIALGLAPDHIRDHAAFASHNHTLRLLEYPPRDPAKDGQWGIGPHTDYGYGALLAQARVPGLEILTRAGEWIQAPALDGHLLFNNGDLCQRWTNERYRAAPHRVINYSGRKRHSVVFFVNPRPDVRLATFDGLSDAANPPKHEPISFGEYLASLRKTNHTLK